MTPAPAARPWYVTCLSLIGVGVLAIVLVIGGLLWLGRGAARPAINRAVYYALSGTSTSASITIHNADGGTEQRTVKVPYESSHRMKAGSFAYISAQNQTSGTLTCKIIVEGSVFKTSTSEGQHKIASCSGSVP